MRLTGRDVWGWARPSRAPGIISRVATTSDTSAPPDSRSGRRRVRVTSIEVLCAVLLIAILGQSWLQQLFDVPVEVTWESAQKARAKATLAISLDTYKVERPSLMFVKVDDELKIDAKLTFTR